MRLFFIECSLPFWIDVADKLMRLHGCHIVYWTGATRIKTLVKEKFPQVIYHHNAEAVRNISPSELFLLDTPPLGNELLDKFSRCESITLKMMDRMARVKELGYNERIHHYHDLLKYWLAVCKKYKPDLVIWPTSPHLVYDYVLYEICKQYNIETIMFEKTTFPGYLLPLRRFDQLNKNVNPRNRQLGTMKLEPEIQDRMDEIKGKFSSGMPFHVKYKAKNKNKSIIVKLYSILKGGVPKNQYRKYIHQNMNDLRISRVRYSYELIKSEINRNKLNRHYKKIVSNPDLNKPFIFVALQCQPERSTSPDGGSFAHQNLMVEMLSKSSPKDWQIYVKEHISQFKGFQRAECARTKEFYYNLLNIPKVQLLPLSITSFKLIDAAKAVATVSGTVGFESIARGKPALIFGHTWYNLCEGAFPINKPEECDKAIAKIDGGYKIKEEGIQNFLHFLNCTSAKGYINNIYSNAVTMNPKENAHSLYKCIVDMTQIKKIKAKNNISMH